MINTATGTEILSKAISYIQQPPLGINIKAWPIFSDMVGGLRENEFTIFCGATGSGKTQFLATLGSELIKQNIKTFVAPVETGAIDFCVRTVSALAQYDYNTGQEIKSIDVARKLMATVEAHKESIDNNYIFSTHDNRVDVDEMVSTLEYMNDAKGVRVAILDNLNFFLKPVSSNNQILEFDDAVHKFVMLAKRIPIHIFLVMHPRKTEAGKINSEFDIKGSATAVQEATNVLLMNRLDDKEIDDGVGTTLTRELKFVKIRKRGFNVGKKIYMDYVGGCYAEREPKRDDSPANGIARKVFKPVFGYSD